MSKFTSELREQAAHHDRIDNDWTAELFRQAAARIEALEAACRPILEAAINSPHGAEVTETKHDVNLDYHVEVTITVGEARALRDVLAAASAAQGAGT